MEQLLTMLHSMSPGVILGIVFGVALVENLFPPAPSDLLIVFAGSLVALEQIGFIETLVCATAGSTAGFMLMYKIGEWFGGAILTSGRFKFLPVDAITKVEGWFARYGYWLIVANRFLSGTRAVISFFAGMSTLRLRETTLLSAMSALAWNALLVGAGYYLGSNWERIGFYLSTYTEIVTSLVILVAILLGTRYVIKRRNGSRQR